MSYESVYSHACSLFDMESLIAYFAVQTYINNSAGDWPRTNIALWRAKKTSEEPYQDGKWRWMLYDLNGGVPMEFSRVNDDTIKYLLDNSLLFKNLWEQPDFKQEFLQRLGKIKELLSGAIVSDYIDDYKSEYLLELKNSFDRFFITDNKEIDDRLESIRLFFTNRESVIDYLISLYS